MHYEHLQDSDLLKKFIHSQDEQAFSIIVHRHSPMVRGVALRACGDSGTADEVTQDVFLILARKASKLLHQPLVAWLHHATYYETKNAIRKSEVYHKKLQKLKEGSTTEDHTSMNIHHDLYQHLDESLVALNTQDRELIIRHYFEGSTVGELAHHYATSSDTCRKRLERALTRLSALLRRRGVTTSVASLAYLLVATPLCFPTASAAILTSNCISAISSNAHIPFISTLSIIMKTKIIKTTIILVILTIFASVAWQKWHITKSNNLAPGNDLSTNMTDAEGNRSADATSRRSVRQTNLAFPQLEKRYGKERTALARKVAADWASMGKQMIRMTNLSEQEEDQLRATLDGHSPKELPRDQKNKMMLESYQLDGVFNLNLNEEQTEKALELVRENNQLNATRNTKTLEQLLQDDTPLLNLLLAADLRADDRISEEEYKGIVDDNRVFYESLAGNAFADFAPYSHFDNANFSQEFAKLLDKDQTEIFKKERENQTKSYLQPYKLEDLHDAIKFAKGWYLDQATEELDKMKK